MTKNDQMELELLKIRVKNLEKQNKELRQEQQKTDPVKTAELKGRWLDVSVTFFTDGRITGGISALIEDDSQEERRQRLYREGLL